MTASGDGIVPMVITSALIAIVLAALGFRRQATSLATRIDAILPQTQCNQCGYEGCRPYAEAIGSGEAAINRCPPGGDRVISKLARITGQARQPLDTSHGVHKPRQLALIDEACCIGCTLCIQACPVDAIVGAPKVMHTVIAAQCTGCELCLAPCPVDCIVLEPAPWTAVDIALGRRAKASRAARSRFDARQRRIERNKQELTARLAAKATAKRTSAGFVEDPAVQRKRAIIEAALERARVTLAASASGGRR